MVHQPIKTIGQRVILYTHPKLPKLYVHVRRIKINKSFLLKKKYIYILLLGTFETAGSGNRYTVRLAQTMRVLKKSSFKSIPRKSAFVAAGFLITHGTFCETIGFDPFLPYLFMGEELALSVRFFTHGFDIYAPSVDVLKHEYVRKESSKFWESVGWVYSNGALHNDLTDLIVERVQYLSGFPEAREIDQIQPKSIVTRIQDFGLGNKRTKDQFASLMGLNYEKRTCTAQDWCITGEDFLI